MKDRKWIILIVLVLLLEVLWLLIDLQWIHVPYFSKVQTMSGDATAGYVLKSKDDLKRRGANSLVWEPAKEKDVLFYHDSVLTLAQSTAKLYLRDQTELELSENTLVTLEEPDDKSKSEIRLRFSKGDLKARNPYATAHIQGEDWVVNVEKGSEVALRKDKNKDSYEFEIISGQASLQTKAGVQNLGDSKIVRMDEAEQVSLVEKSKAIKWTDQRPERKYIFEESTGVDLNWQGEATAVVINETNEQQLKPEQQQSRINFDVGNYKLRLKDQNGLSEVKSIEVRKAPKIILKSPLPRERLSTGEPHEFVWTSEKGVKDFILHYNGKTEIVTDNFKTLQFDEDTDVDWKVEGRDDEGNIIPALYENRVYFRKNPLQAPKLKTPGLLEIEDGPSGSFHWWQLLLNSAQAAGDNFEVNFEWEPVIGADHYTIEVSTDPDFKTTELNEKVNGTFFKWRKYSPKKKYYWRVAAGSHRRMGLFSEGIELKPELIKKVKPPVAVVIEEKPVAPTPPPPPEPIPNWSLAWTPAYKLSHTQGENKSNVELAGLVPLSLQLEFQNAEYDMRLAAASQKWQPKAASPLQSDLRIPELWLLLAKEHWGVSLHESFTPERLSDTSVGVQNQLLLGLRYSYNIFGAAIMTSGDVQEFVLDFQYKQPVGKIYFFGLGGNALLQINKSSSGHQENLNFIFGANIF